MHKLLVIDDEPGVLYSLGKGLAAPDLEVLTAETARAGLELIGKEDPDVVILDVRLPDMSGLDAFDRIHAADRRLPVIIITAYSTTETAIEAMKRGAFEYLLKPLDLAQLREIVHRALETSRLSRVPALFEEPAEAIAPADRIVGRSAAMQNVYKSIGRVASQDVTVLVLGESGTGKELVARAIYHHGKRKDAPFVAINCAAIPETLLESELFGHERGAFTGAERERVGKFEQANGGTIFLDEIGDMSPATQAKVLRLLQDQTFERLGGNETVRTNVRIIAATNRDLEAAVAGGEFRQDLYYRLNVFAIRLPPLRERKEDLPLLVEHFLALLGRDLDRSVRRISPDAMRCLETYDWPGNVRELSSALKHALVKTTGEVLTVDTLPESVRGGNDGSREDAGRATAGPTSSDGLVVENLVEELLRAEPEGLYEEVHAEIDRVLLRLVLERVDGNQVEAARRLGIARNTLRARLRSLGLTVAKRVRSEEEEPDES